MEEKIKLIKLHANSWHNRLMRYVLGDKAPGPHNMFNLCPYFWILIFCIFSSPFVFIAKAITFIVSSIVSTISKYLSDSLYVGYLKSLTEDEILALHKGYGYIKGNRWRNHYRAPFYINKEESQIVSEWFKEYYNINTSTSEGWKSIFDKIKEIQEERIKIREEQQLREEELIQKNKIERIKKKDKLLKNLNFINDKFDNLIASVKESFSFLNKLNNFNYSSIIKITKKFFGLLITLTIASGLYFILSGLIKFILFLIDIWNWAIILSALKYIGIGLGITIVLVLFIVGIIYLKEYISDKYKYGKKVFLVELVKYIFLYPLYYVVALPIYFIFVKFLWELLIIRILYKLILVSIGMFLKFLFNSILSSTGIFGQYFKSTYSDLCPGIEWEE